MKHSPITAASRQPDRVAPIDIADDGSANSRTSRDLTIEELRILGVALDLAESPVTLYGRDNAVIYANASARSYWPVTFAAIDKGLSMEEATRMQIRTFAPEISEAEMDSNIEEIFDGFHSKEPTLIHASQNRLCRTTHHPIGNIAIAGMGIDITELHKKRKQLGAARASAEFRAAHDSLTSLPNRSRFRRILEEKIADEHCDSFWLLMCDIDKFKLVNDVYGHDVGDAVLIEFAHFMTETMGEDIIISRLGGDEFAILVCGKDCEKILAADLKNLIDQKPFVISVGNQHLEIDFSVGAALYPEDSATYTDLLKCADLALLRSKGNGLTRIDIYDHALGAEYLSDLNLFSEIEIALEQNQIIPYFQPIIDVTDQGVQSLEALARWQHPKRGLLTPVDFQKTFDDRGLSLELSKYMLRSVTGMMVEWMRAGVTMCSVNINVEASDLLNPSFLTDLMTCSTKDGLLPEQLGIEITENSILNVDNEALLNSLEAIRKLGIKVYLDDFGTGFSSITHLDHLPITGLKLDKSYVQKVCENKRSQKIVGAIVNLAQELKLNTVAEGIEDEQALEAMRQLGCTTLQGYYFSYPLSPEEAQRFLQQPAEIHFSSTG